jgi:hypothetical protein
MRLRVRNRLVMHGLEVSRGALQQLILSSSRKSGIKPATHGRGTSWLTHDVTEPTSADFPELSDSQHTTISIKTSIMNNQRWR